MKEFYFFLGIFAIVCSASRFRHFQLETTKIPTEYVTAYFKNRIDHFNLSSSETYSQRYWYTEEFWEKDKGPMILYILGEAPGSPPSTRTIPLEYTKELKGKFFALEHRFYGTSQPCKDWSLECLRLLNHHQAMADIANFIEAKNKELREPKKAKWLVVGGSYAGALVGWLKSKYPHLVNVAYSSSGVVNAILDYYMYMYQISINLKKDNKCFNTIAELNSFATMIIQKGKPEEKQMLKSAMNATFLEDLDFLSYFSQLYVPPIQYSARKKVCPLIIELSNEKSMIKRASLYAKLGLSLGVSPKDYTLEEEKDIHISFNRMGRQWTYQICSSLAYFITGGSNNPIYPSILNVDYYKTICKRVFGTDIFPNVDYTNGITGDLRIPPLLENIAFSHGGDDPWQWAGIRNAKITNEKRLVEIINCDDCAHCIDLYTPKPDDPEALVNSRKKIKKLIFSWINSEEEE